MPGSLHTLEATPLSVAGLSVISQGETWEAEQRGLVRLEPLGIPEDRHYGATRVVRPYESAELSGLEVANDRQISIVDAEDMRVIAEGLELPADAIQEMTDVPIEQFLAGQLAANILLRSAPGEGALSEVAEPGNILVFTNSEDEATAAVRLSEYNPPCIKPMRKLFATLEALGLSSDLTTAELGKRFKEAGHNRRGWVGSVYSPGNIALGQGVSLYKPLTTPPDEPGK